VTCVVVSEHGKVMIKILQGSAVAQTVLGGQTIRPRIANVLSCMSAKNCENCLDTVLQ